MTNEIVVHKQISRLDDSLFSKEQAPHYMQLATKLCSSELVPKSFQGKPQNLFIAWAMGYQIGMAPEQAMQCIAVINGRASMWGDDMLALCMAHKDFEDIIEEPILNKDGSVVGYQCGVKRKGMSVKSNIFTLEMAKKAGLLGKAGPWTQYPERMLKLRARGFSLRDAFPDALKGIKPREEVEDYIEVEYKQVDDKMSRTEFLKKDLIDKRNVDENDSKDFNMEPLQEDKQDNKKTDSETFIEELGADGEEESKPASQSIPDGKITAEQIETIEKLIEEKSYTEDRISKAMKYYEVDNIATMGTESAAHFINQLNKS